MNHISTLASIVVTNLKSIEFHKQLFLSTPISVLRAARQFAGKLRMILDIQRHSSILEQRHGCMIWVNDSISKQVCPRLLQHVPVLLRA